MPSNPQKGRKENYIMEAIEDDFLPQNAKLPQRQDMIVMVGVGAVQPQELLIALAG